MVESRVLPSIVDLVPSLIGYDPESVVSAGITAVTVASTASTCTHGH